MSKIAGFAGDYTGLTPEQAHQKVAQQGRNELAPAKRPSLARQIFKTVTEPMFLLLFATAAIYFALDELADGIIMLLFVAVVAAIELIQEYKTDRTVEALRELSSPKVQVVRGGEVISIESELLAEGDLMLLEEGDKIAADARILEQFDLGVNQSPLTGESDVIYKTAGTAPEGELFARNMVYQGTLVISGTAITEVIATGPRTQSGQIGKQIAEAPDRPTLLEKQTAKLIKICTMVGLSLLGAVFLITYLRTGSLVESVLSGITLAMGIIPEEFPVILTVFLSMGALRLARRQSLVRRLPSVETLGAINVLCVDKTGTLTVNRMTVQSHYTEREEQDFWRHCALACEAEPYDPMEQAILAHTGKPELGELVFEYSFSSERKMMGHVYREGTENHLCAKGSPEAILPLCGLSPQRFALLEAKQEEFARRGERVIAVAHRHFTDAIPEELDDNPLDFYGFVGFTDPPRPEVPDAARRCREAGVRVVMITGDNPITALAIARQVGIQSETAITGDQLDSMTEQELRREVLRCSVFARVAPKHKMQIVQALKAEGLIVAMTGDGVNDAPALKYSDIGIAMGGRGTNVAKEAADMVLLDDNFATIVDTVEDGRRIYDNIRKTVGYVFVVHIPFVLLALLAPLMGLPLMLLPIHIVMLELVIDPMCAVIFERQPAERDVMRRSPRRLEEPLVTKGTLLLSLLKGFVIFAAAFGGYFLLLRQGAPVELARGFALATLILSNLLVVYVSMSQTYSAAYVFRFFLHDKLMWAVNLAILAGLLLVLYLPALSQMAGVAPLTLMQLGCAAALAFGATFWYELVKAVQNRRRG